MRPWFSCSAVVTALFLAGPAVAAPVYINPRLDSGVVAPETPVVAFSYDVRTVYAQVASRFERTRPKPPAKGPLSPRLPLLHPPLQDYLLVYCQQLEDFRDNFARAHKDQPEMVKSLMLRFDAIFERFGEKSPFSSAGELVASENPRQVWAAKVTAELNAVITQYNASLGNGAETTYAAQLTRWRAQRNEMWRQAAMQAGANPTVNYLEGSTNANGTAVLDLPPGTWWVAVAGTERAWYRPIRVGDRGGHVILGPQEVTDQPVNLQAWTGD